MTATSTSTDNATSTVSEQIEAFSHKWDHYFYPPYGTQLWPGLAKINRISEGLLRVGKTIIINVLPAAIPLQVLIYFEALNWTNIVLDALLVLEIGPCRILTRLVDKVAPYPCEEICP